jgi:FixJ family two-component response regulator
MPIGVVSVAPTVFVVDDDPSVRKALRRLIRSAGLNVEVFASAEEFLDFERYDGPACLVLDIQMPGLSGLQLQEQLATSGSHLPIIFITAYEDANVRARALDQGAARFLEKPFDDEVLLDAIRSATRDAA